jgi:hypothetical protein
MEKTITQIINDFQNEAAREDLLPDRAKVILIQLSALLGNINAEIRKRDKAYKLVLQSCYELEKSSNRAKIRAEVSDEYEAMKTARDTKELARELIRSLKYYLKGFQEEYQHGSNF